MIEQQDVKLWPTQVRVGKLDLSPETNAELARIVKEYSQLHMHHYKTGFKNNVPYNIALNYPHPAVDEYVAALKREVELYLLEVAGLTAADYTEPHYNLFGNHEVRAQWTIPHTHQGNQLVATYYPEVIRNPDEPHPFAGSFIFHNPISMQSGFWARKVNSFYPVKPESGSLVIMPGNAEHSTFPFFCEGSSKCALACNVRFRGTREGHDSEKNYATFDQIEARREQLKENGNAI